MEDADVLNWVVERCEAAGLPGKQSQAILDRYSEPWRVYHGVKHITTLFGRAIRQGCELQSHHILALLFHDAI